jgi:hypothetical protein
MNEMFHALVVRVHGQARGVSWAAAGRRAVNVGDRRGRFPASAETLTLTAFGPASASFLAGHIPVDPVVV